MSSQFSVVELWRVAGDAQRNESDRNALLCGACGIWSRAMYVKTTSRKVEGGEVRYLHLAHNEWDAAARRSVPKMLDLP